MEQKGVTVIFIAPYSPQLNSIEEVFGYLKAKYRSTYPRPSTREEMKFRVEEICTELKTYDFSPYIERSFEFVEAAIELQHF
jgi:transposase